MTLLILPLLTDVDVDVDVDVQDNFEIAKGQKKDMQASLVNDPRQILKNFQHQNDSALIAPWVFTEHKPHRFTDQRSNLYQAISISRLLRLMYGIVVPYISQRTESPRHLKLCADDKYCISYHRPAISDSQLFVQHRADYFVALELFIDDKLSLDFREPLWPQLHPVNQLNNDIRLLPMCIQALQTASIWSIDKPDVPEKYAQDITHDKSGLIESVYAETG